MELKDIKYVANTGKLPGYDIGTPGTQTPVSKPYPGGVNAMAQGGIWGNRGAFGFLNNYVKNTYGEQPKIVTPASNRVATPTSQAPKVPRPQPSTNNGITINAGTGYETGGPTQSDSMAASIGPWFAAGAWAGGGILEGIGRIKTADEHLADAGTSEASLNGITYTQQNSVDSDKIKSDYDKNVATDFLTNPFRGFAGLFGRGKARREAELASKRATMQQEAARDSAYAKYLGLDFAKKYGNLEDQVLYAKDGKLPGFVGGKPTYTAMGATGVTPNAKLSGKEIVYNIAEGTASEVGGPANNKDKEYGFLRASDGVLSNKPGLFGYSPADMFRATGNIEASENYMVASNLARGKRMYKNGKLPRFKEGWASSFIPSAIGALASIDQMYQAYRNQPYRPNTYASNPYELEGLSTLAGLRINPYPIIQQMRSAEARTNRAIDIAGGLSGSQRAAARLANLSSTQRNIANTLSGIQQQNNTYLNNYAQAAINAGQASRQARMAANQWDLDYYSKAHAARSKGIQTGIANTLAQVQSYISNDFTRRQFNKSIGLYEADQKLRQDELDWYKDNAAKLASGTMFNIPSAYRNKPLFYQDENGNYVRIDV